MVSRSCRAFVSVSVEYRALLIGLCYSGRWLASSSIDGLTHLWDLTTPKAPPRVIALKDCVDSMSSISAVSTYFVLFI